MKQSGGSSLPYLDGVKFHVDDNDLMDADFAIPSGVHDDPAMYLAISRFNRTQDFDFDLNGTPTRATVSYALTYAPPEAYWPVVVFFNGLGGHRLIAALIEGIAREHGVQVLTLDKHAAGGSVVNGSPSIPLSDRTRFMHAGLLAVLDRLRITRFAVMSPLERALLRAVLPPQPPPDPHADELDANRPVRAL
ncbi:Cellobiohydrolase I [Mycena kentingensis (nom. inval.)]|nr:Cellobiohydrolase I [Mycena kentingensis (nom. inval.)]